MQYDHTIAAGVDMAGRGLILLSLTWGAIVLYRQGRQLTR